MARLKIAPQRGHAVALAEIVARQAGRDVILVMALPHASLSTAEGELGRHVGSSHPVGGGALAAVVQPRQNLMIMWTPCSSHPYLRRRGWLAGLMMGDRTSIN